MTSNVVGGLCVVTVPGGGVKVVVTIGTTVVTVPCVNRTPGVCDCDTTITATNSSATATMASTTNFIFFFLDGFKEIP